MGENMNNFDLHMHSNYSADGQLSAQELIQMAKEKELKIVALSDHDTIAGVNEMIEAGKKEGIRVIPAIECSTKLGHYDVHLLGYGIDTTDPYFTNLQKKLKEKSSDIFHQRVEKLRKKYGVEIDEEQVIRDSKGKNPWFLMMSQLFEDPRYQDIEDFQDYLKGGKRCDPAPVNFFWDKCGYGSDLYVENSNPDFAESVKKIHEAHGIAIVAHPFKTFYKNEEMLQKLLESGVDGMEVYSNYHNPEQIAFYEAFAKENNLLITCGSDFHGILKPTIEMGEYGLKKDGQAFIQAFLERLEN